MDDISKTKGLDKSAKKHATVSIAERLLEKFEKDVGSSITDDKKLIQMYNAYDDVSKALFMLYERAEEWHSLYDQENKEQKQRLAKKLANEGGELSGFGDMLQIMEAEKNALEKDTREQIREAMPNFCSLVEEMMAARMLAMSGGLEKLARMTSSSIQLLGAEKALFRHLKNRKEKPPKFGIIYSTKQVQSVSDAKKGKAARLLAAKLMKAARIDYYSKRIDSSLASELEKEMRKLR